MKFITYLSACAMLALTLSGISFAKAKDSGKFDLTDTASVGSTTLAPGQYKAQWSGPANAVNIQILQKGKVVATTQGKVEDLQRPAPYDATTVKTLANNSKQVDAIQFNNRTQELVLGGM